MDIEKVMGGIVDSAVMVNRALGSGFLEKVYQQALAVELSLRGLKTETEIPIEVFYKGQAVGFYRADILVADAVIIETKVCEAILKAHELQLVNYLRASGYDHGIIINFGQTPLGFKRKFRDFIARD
ncbi:MAG: GxxExxY protein [Muribaculaceae bacterium]|nr:GxxExxY protein [Muribaculaceae bacterium]